eukprot:m.263358 g.263358  ORF g.263358 m.263358 type:complete len:1042 (+) comp26666_c0_seq1:28-3153(+)
MRLAGVLLGLAAAASAYSIHWHSPAEFGTNEAHQQTYFSAMPLGNGDLVALVWPNMSAGGLQMYVRKADAMSSQSELFTLASIQILVGGIAPSPFTRGSYYNQTLDLQTATMRFYAGGTGFADHTIELSVWIDALTNHVLVNATSPQQQFTLTVNIASVRPETEWTYSVPFVCAKGISQPDVVVDPLPPVFDPNSLVLYHRNDPARDGSTVAQTLTQQGLADLISATPDWWSNLQFGVAVFGMQNAGQLQRTSPTSLQSSAPCHVAHVTIAALSAVTDTPADWMAKIARLGSPSEYVEHVAWWDAFWARSYINVSCSPSSKTAPPEPVDDAPTISVRRAAPAALPVGDPAVWLDAAALTLGDGERVALWPDLSGNSYHAVQASPVRQPIYFRSGALGGQPTVHFDGQATALFNSNASVQAEKTIIAVFRDTGSKSVCCNPVIYFPHANCNGLDTANLAGANDDDAVGGPPIAIMADACGAGDHGDQNINNRTVIAVVTFSAANTTAYVNGCEQVVVGATGAAGTGFEIGGRDADGSGSDRHLLGDISEIIVYSRALTVAERTQVEAYLAAKWVTSSLPCTRGNACAVINQQQAVTRYVQTIQSRTMWPIKFNGMLFQAATPPNADYRDWGPSNWWQNTRLSYGSMLETGDADVFETILKYYNNTLPFAAARTQAYFNHTGIFYTETKHILGAFAGEDYGCSRPQGWPVWLETNDYIKNDYGGDGGTPEVAMAVLDHYLYTQDEATLQAYLPIATLAMDFFMQHYPNRTSDGKVVVWPTQALETFWCAGWDVAHNRPPENCCVDDLPTVAGMRMLAERLLQLPARLTTPAQRAAWTAFSAKIPELPLTPDGSMFAAARVISSGVHNSETPELYCVHPYRLVTVGRNLTQGVRLDQAIKAFAADGNAHSNTGWNQGIMNAALLGMTDTAATMLKQRAATGPAPGYRFPGFMPHFQDYEPSANHLANYLTALNWMLLQPADDAAGSMVLFGAWPCDWSVSFSLKGPLNTTVEVVYTGGTPTGTLVSLIVTPPSRRSAVLIANCV